MMKNICFMLLLVVLTLTSCSLSGSSFIHKSLKISQWNLQSFFDSETSGNEYEDFRDKSLWNSESYKDRLKRLSQAIKVIDADVFIMEEVENEAVLKDIFNFLEVDTRYRKLYPYAAFARSQGSCIGLAVMSRYPLGEVKIHHVKSYDKFSSMPYLRPILEVKVFCEDGTVCLFINHWKSRAGGADKSEKWRKLQEKSLCYAMKNAIDRGDAVIAAGDFNRDVKEFRNKDGLISIGCLSDIKTPDMADTEDEGSYCYRGEWSLIDNYYFYNIQMYPLKIEKDGPWYYSEKRKPYAFNIRGGYGYSDHLPVSSAIVF